MGRTLVFAWLAAVMACAGQADRTPNVRFEIRGLRVESNETEYATGFYHKATLIALGDSAIAARPYLAVIRINKLSGGDPDENAQYPIDAVVDVDAGEARDISRRVRSTTRHARQYGSLAVKRSAALPLLLLPLLCCACSQKLHVRSDASWSGALGGNSSASVDGSGSRAFDVNGSPFCWSFQKDTEGGYLEAYVSDGFLSGKQGEARTTASFGVVTGCAN